MSEDDLKIYARFYGVSDVTVKAIQNFENSRLKPLTNFLNGKSDLSVPFGADFLAILVGFEKRPFQKFRKMEIEKASNIKRSDDVALNKFSATETNALMLNESSVGYDRVGENRQNVAEDISMKEITNDNGVLTDKELVTEGDVHVETVIIPQKILATQRSYPKFTPKVFVLVVGVLCLLGIYMLINTSSAAEGCMVWKGDHYETVSCDTQINAYASQKIVPADELLLNYQRKIEKTDTVKFFNPDNQAKVFYAKMPDKKCEFFTYPGKHPETGKHLKPVTPYIINKYVRIKE